MEEPLGAFLSPVAWDDLLHYEISNGKFKNFSFSFIFELLAVLSSAKSQVRKDHWPVRKVDDALIAL